MRSTMMDFPLTVRHIFWHGRTTSSRRKSQPRAPTSINDSPPSDTLLRAGGGRHLVWYYAVGLSSRYSRRVAAMPRTKVCAS